MKGKLNKRQLLTRPYSSELCLLKAHSSSLGVIQSTSVRICMQDQLLAVTLNDRYMFARQDMQCTCLTSPVVLHALCQLMQGKSHSQEYLARSVSTTLGKIVMTLMPCSFIACTAHALNQAVSVCCLPLRLLIC